MEPIAMQPHLPTKASSPGAFVLPLLFSENWIAAKIPCHASHRLSTLVAPRGSYHHYPFIHITTNFPSSLLLEAPAPPCWTERLKCETRWFLLVPSGDKLWLPADLTHLDRKRLSPSDSTSTTHALTSSSLLVASSSSCPLPPWSQISPWDLAPSLLL